MAGFQIKNADNQELFINDLDKEAAEFWDKPLGDVYYASPQFGMNWFDSIGWNIANPKVEYTRGWANIKESLFIVQVMGLTKEKEEDKRIERLKSIFNYLQPYFDLIDHWESKGYIPIKVN